MLGAPIGSNTSSFNAGHAAEGAGKASPVLWVEGISKTFPGTRALDDVVFDLLPGEVHALCGENGAGKSTLMKILAGSIRPDSGRMYHNDEEIWLGSPLDARRRGILLVHQEISLVPELSVAENIYLGNLPASRLGRVDKKKLHRQAEAVLRECGYDVRASDKVADLPIAKQQMVEIARATAFNCSVVIFDEPTASLTDTEIVALFNNIDNLRRRGVGIVYISHKMREIFTLADRITVLRDGAIRGTRDRAATNEQEITSLMIGRSLDQYFERTNPEFGPEVLRLEGVIVEGSEAAVDLSVRRGEVLGLYGLVGAGRSELAEAIFGLRPLREGRLYWNGVETSIRSVRDAVGLGIGLVPEDRKKQGLVLALGCQDNLVMAVMSRLCTAGFRRSGAEALLFADYRKQLGIKTSAPGIAASTLSGGNQQKIVLGKWLASKPKLLILDEPTRGIDVGAKAEVHKLISELASEGMAIILISSEMPEVLGLSHRVLTVQKGAITGSFSGQDATEDALMRGVIAVKQ